MQQCGFCSMLSGLVRRAMCVGSRRGSSESYYRELGDQDTLKIEDKSSDISDNSVEITSANQRTLHSANMDLGEELCNVNKKNPHTGRFLTMHKRRKKRLLTRALSQEAGLLEDLQPSQVQCVLEQSALWRFNAFTLENVSGGRCLPVLCLHLFHWYGLLSHFHLDVAKLWKLFSLIEEGYHSTNPYHNSIHAADVTQAMHCFLQQKQIRENLQPLEIMASLIAAIAHDVDHPGVNQPFLIATSNHLAALYQNTSVLENHHWRSAISCLMESGLTDQLKGVQSQLEHQISSLILATDITRQQEFLHRFKGYLDSNTLDMRRADHRHLVLQIALKCADISNPCRPWDISRKWSLKVCEEFFRQGDYERKLNLPVTALCDRHTISIPKIQTGFFKFVVTPLVMEWHRFLQNDLSEQMLKNLRFNQLKWESLVAQEIAEETRTEISDADIIEDDLETCSGTNISDSAELLLPLRRSSLNTTKQISIKDQFRRFSVPLNVFQDSKLKNREKLSQQTSIADANSFAGSGSLDDSDKSLHSQLSVRGHCHTLSDKDKVLSTEKLLPDLTIASITTPRQATRLSVVRESGLGWKLFRQQTFPPLESALRMSAMAPTRAFHTSNEDAIYPSHFPKTDIGQKLIDTNKYKENRFSNIFKHDYDKTDNDDASERNIRDNVADRSHNLEKENLDPSVLRYSQRGRRESAPVGSQLKDNLTSVQLSSLMNDNLLHRRKSMPTDSLNNAPNEKKLKDLSTIMPHLLSRTLSCKESWVQRRGSAPVVVSELRGISGFGGLTASVLRHSVNGNRRKPNTISACHQWLAKTSYSIQEGSMPFARRSSLPVEVLTGASTQ